MLLSPPLVIHTSVELSTSFTLTDIIVVYGTRKTQNAKLIAEKPLQSENGDFSIRMMIAISPFDRHLRYQENHIDAQIQSTFNRQAIGVD